MEKNYHLSLASSRSESLLTKYRQLTSPIVSMHTVKRQDCLKDELKNNVSTKLENIKGRGSKLYALNASLSFSELKASAVLYQIPEFSTPEINYEVADHIKLKVEEMKNQIITHLPEISKSSNYAPKKIEHQLNHRSAVRELEEWLKQKLKSPPQNYEESVEYKNMIMGIGMKELIRIIGKRCGEEGRMAEQIWQLTWHICREIIIYLSKRAKKCEDLLQEELQFMRDSYQKEFQRLKQQNNDISSRIANLIKQNKQFESQIVKLKKKKNGVEDENKTLTFDNHHIRQQFRKVLEQNLAIYLQIGNKNKRDWIKKMYKSIVTVSAPTDSIFKGQMKQQVAAVMGDRIRQQGITEDCKDTIGMEDIQSIEKQVERNIKKQQKTKTKIKSQKTTKKQINVETTMVTELQTIQPEQSIQHTDEDDNYSSQSSCDEIVNNLREEFKPVDAATSTQEKHFHDAFASTAVIKFSDVQTQVNTHYLNMLEQIGINTQQVKDDSNDIIDELKDIKDDSKNIKKKMNKQNSKQDSRVKLKQKKISNSMVRDKYRGRSDNKKLTLDIVHEEFPKMGERKSQMYQELVSGQTNHSTDVRNLSFAYRSQTGSVILNSSTEQVGNSTQKINEVLNNIRNASLKQDHSLQKSKTTNIQKLYQPQTQNRKVDNIQLNQSSRDSSYISVIQAKFLQKFIGQENSNQFRSIRSNSLADQGKELKQIPQQSTRIQTEGQLLMYICAQCHKIITADQQKYLNSKISNRVSQYKKNNKMERTQSKKYDNPINPLEKAVLAVEKTNNEECEENRQHKYSDQQGRKNRRHMTVKTTTYNHDISFKKELEDQQHRKTYHLSNFNNQYHQTITESDEIEQKISIFPKTTSFKLLYNLIIDSNKDHISLIVNGQQQVTENLDNYFEMVKQISSIPQHKITMTEKAILNTIEKNIFPIINELLLVVRKAVKYHHITETLKMFTSLPNIIYHRMSRKYGVKILAIKNIKLLLMALKAAGRYTQKYKVIELMMFTDCKSPNSEDLFMYLLIMGLIDPTFSSNKLLTNEELFTIKALCEEHLTKQSTVYVGFEDVSCQQVNMKTKSNIALMDIVKSIITNYRLLKINRIEQLGFIFVMLKKDHSMSFKNFVYFLSCLTIKNNLKVVVIKKLLQYCDVKNKDQRVGITENMFTKFLMDCDVLTFQLLSSAVKKQTQSYHEKNKEVMVEVVSRLFVTKTNTIDQSSEVQVSQQQVYNKYKGNSITQTSQQIIRLQKSLSIDQHKMNEQKHEFNSKSIIMKQLKDYSWFTELICNYLQNQEEVKYLSQKQISFIKEYLMVHLIQNEVEKVIGVTDYFANSMLDIFSIPMVSLSVQHSPHTNK